MKEARKEYRDLFKDIYFIILIGILIFLFFNKFKLFTGHIYSGDVLEHEIPSATFLVRSVRNGIFPLWNPYILCGAPFTTPPYMGPFYPLVILFFAMPIFWAINFGYLIHLILAGISTFFLARVLKLGRVSSFIVTSCFIFSKIFHFLILNGHLSVLISVAYMPAIFLFFEMAMSNERKRFLLSMVGGIIVGLMFLGGHPSFAIISCAALSFYFLARTLQIVLWEKTLKSFLAITEVFTIIITIGLCLSAIQWLPMLEVIHFSSYKLEPIKPESAKTLSHLFSYLFPYLDKLDSGMGYVGITALILSFVGFIFRRNKYTVSFSFMAIVSMLLSLGNYTPVYRLFCSIVPYFDMIRYPSEFENIFIFSVSFLAGFGTDFLLGLPNEIEKKRLLKAIKVFIIAGILFLSIVLFYAFYRNGNFYDKNGIVKSLPQFFFFFCFSIILLVLKSKDHLKQRYMRGSLIFLVLFDLTVYTFCASSINNIAAYDFNTYFRRNKIIDFLERDPDIYRVLSIEDTGKDKCNLKLNQGMIHKYQSICGVTKIPLMRYSKFIRLIEKIPHCELENTEDMLANLKDYDNKLLDLLNVKYILTNKEIKSNKFNLVFNTDGLMVYRNNFPQPRAYVVHNVKVIEKEEELLNELINDDFDFKETVIFEEDFTQLLPSLEVKKECKVYFKKYSPNKIILSTALSQPGILVLSEIYMPGWKVLVDNKQARLYQANYILRAVYLPKGQHEIKFIYCPLTFKAGFCLTLITIFLLLTIFCFQRKSN